MAREDEIIKIVESWRSSGKSRIVFARESGISISTLQRWIRRSEQQAPVQSLPPDAAIETPTRFVEIAHEQSVTHEQPGTTRWPQAPREREARLRLELGDGVILTLY